jgi:transposase-like protein
MASVLHGSARTTPRIRAELQAELQASKESARALAARYGLNAKTVRKWRRRTTTADEPMGPKTPKSTVLTPAEEAIVVAFRQKTLLPLDDVLGCLKDAIPNLSRSALHRCLQRHGVSRLPVEKTQERRKRFKAYEIGYVHIDSCELRHADGKLVMFLAIDRVSKFTYVEFHDSVGKMEGSAFVKVVVRSSPTRSIPCLPTAAWPSPTCPRIARAPAAASSVRTSSIASVWQTPIEHRLTTDVIDKCFLARSELFSSRAWVTARRRAGREAQALPRSLHRRTSVAAPVRTRLGPRGFQPETKRA